MQSIGWYLKRLQAMSAGEVAWRLREAAERPLDRLRVAARWYPAAPRAAAGHRDGAGRSFARAPGAAPGGNRLNRTPIGQEAPNQPLLDRAQKARGHLISFFDLVDQDLGTPIDWHRDHSQGITAPVKFSPSIDYRRAHLVGDCKLVWEPNRHQHLVVLGRAYHSTGERCYAEAIIEQLDSWLDQNPFGKGMNWRSPLELGIRIINWAWTLDLIRESGLVAGAFRNRLLRAAYLHLWEIQRRYSRGSSANNHLIGEAAGVYIGASFFRELALPAEWRRRSREILHSEIVRQTYEDGCTREQAFGYHLFVIQFFLFAGLVGRWTGEEFSQEYWKRLECMVEYAGLLGEGGAGMPMVGDADDGYVLDLGPGGMDPAGIFCTAAILFNRPDFRRWSGGFAEMSFWLLGDAARERFERVPAGEAVTLESRSFPESGYYLLQCGDADSPERISLIFDCGDLGYGSIAAHGHADALSLVLRAFGMEVLVDPGTYDYFTHPEWRSYFRSTRAHNTLVIDGQDQSVMLGSFLWGKRAESRCLAWEPSPQGGFVVGEHNGYARLRDPVMHRRRVELRADERTVVIRDEILAAGTHAVELWFHFAEGCTCSYAGGNRITVDTGRGQVTFELDPQLTARIVHGGDSPGPGWVSRGYHRKTAAPALLLSGNQTGNSVFEHRISIGLPGAP